MDNSIALIYAPILLMTLFGLPHGALDAALLTTIGHSNRRTFAFVAYIAIAMICILIWFVAPTPAMFLFLALSTWHFGRSDIVDQTPQHPLLHTVARGGVWSLFLPLYHWSSTEPIFAQLNTDTFILKMGLVLAVSLWLLSGLRLLYVGLTDPHKKLPAALLVGVMVAALLPPLWSLCAYFCAWHARRHTQQTLARLSNTENAVRLGRIITVLTLVIAAVVFVAMPTEISVDTAVIRLFFVGIFALTVPHMILIDYYLGRTNSLGAQA